MSNKSYKYLYEKYKIKYLKLKTNNILIGGGKPNWLIEMSNGNIKFNNKIYVVSKDSFYLEQQYKEKNDKTFKLVDDGPIYKLNIYNNSGTMIIKDNTYNIIRVYKTDNDEYINIINNKTNMNINKIDTKESKETDTKESKETDTKESKETDTKESKETDTKKSKKVDTKESKKVDTKESKKVDTKESNKDDAK